MWVVRTYYPPTCACTASPPDQDITAGLTIKGPNLVLTLALRWRRHHIHCQGVASGDAELHVPGGHTGRPEQHPWRPPYEGRAALRRVVPRLHPVPDGLRPHALQVSTTTHPTPIANQWCACACIGGGPGSVHSTVGPAALRAGCPTWAGSGGTPLAACVTAAVTGGRPPSPIPLSQRLVRCYTRTV